MRSKVFERKHKEDKPVLAICYDFDKTLSPKDMQAQGYIQSLDYKDVDRFWIESNALAEDNNMDQNLAYMYKMVEEAEGTLIFNENALKKYGSKVELFPGVVDWFERINDYGKEQGVIVEHYVISSGLKEMIEGTEIAKNGCFEKIYASAFYYNSRGVAKWPAQVVNYTNKTQFLFRIEKGVLDINDPGVNDYFQPDEIRVPFRNMVYIGDSDTDIPCMKLVNTYGGYSIGVYDNNDKEKVYKMMEDNRIKYYAPANYNSGSKLDVLIKSIIDRTVMNEKLEKLYYEDKNEAFSGRGKEYYNDDSQEKEDLIGALESSSNFASTHTIIKNLKEFKGWNKEQKEKLFTIAINNSQVQYILSDSDIMEFYEHLLSGEKELSEVARNVMDLIKDVGN